MLMISEVFAADADRVAAIGSTLADELVGGDSCHLSGPLGAGKTTLVRGLLRTLGHEGPVPSPTFTLVQIYENGGAPVWHFDLYRLEDSKEIYELGIEEAFDNAICLIEWPEKMAGNEPPDWLEMRLTVGESETSRRAAFTSHGARAAHLVRRLWA